MYAEKGRIFLKSWMKGGMLSGDGYILQLCDKNNKLDIQRLQNLLPTEGTVGTIECVPSGEKYCHRELTVPWRA
jgi:hypothetical protein